ncbi:MAG TPA: nitrilase-related carbon-nitrogen hydrolase [Longimicrobiales bacterium]|nr:nitrilase-related carbon-nitrogen hydrolase [Longimicrobiales bacterium]
MMSTPSAVLRLAVVQTAPVLREPARNAGTIARHARDAAADIVLTPELSLTGYDVGDAVHELARDVVPGRVFAEPALATVPGYLVAGCIEAARRGPFNTAAVLHAGRVHFRHRKLYLPTYGMFDEGRWFGRGTTLHVWTLPNGWRIGILICEDFWHPGLIYTLASRGIDALLVQAAAPGRGAWEGSAHGRFASADVWERIARTTAQLHGIYVALANRTGVEGGVTFAGGSLVAGPDGSLLARAADRGEDVLSVEMSRAAVLASRRPYSHERDDDVRLVIRELERGLAEPT